MALVNCPECGHQVSDSAAACPQCGFGVVQYMERQREIQRIQEEAEHEAYATTKRIMAERAVENERLRKEAEERQRKEAERIEQCYVDAVNKYNSDEPDQILRAKELFLSISDYKDARSYIINCDARYATVKQEYEIKIGKKLLEREKRLHKLKKPLIACILLGMALFLTITVANSNKNTNATGTAKSMKLTQNESDSNDNSDDVEGGVFSNNRLYSVGNIRKNIKVRLGDFIPEGAIITEKPSGELCIENEELLGGVKREPEYSYVITYCFICGDNGDPVKDLDKIPGAFYMLDMKNKEYNIDSMMYFLGLNHKTCGI